MPACKFDLRDKIIAEANSQGVPAEIALAVASHESKICHWAPNGDVLRGSSGEYGVMQLMPATAAGLGVDPTDVDQNIHGGVKFLRQLYDRYGDWQLAVQHYNGSGPRAQAYAQSVMAIARGYGFGLTLASSRAPRAPLNLPSASRPTLIIAGVAGGAALLTALLAG